VLQPTSQAFNFGEVNLEFVKEDDKWHIAKTEGKIIPMSFDSDLLVEELVKDYEEKVNIYLDKVITHIEGESLLIKDEFEARLNNHPLFKLLNDAQLEVSNAMISCSSLPNNIKGLNKNVSIRDIESSFIYPNSLYILEITGKILKAALEKTASYFMYHEGKIVINPSFMNPKVEHYNYDVYANIEYEIDVSKPIGQRITKLIYQNRNVTDNDIFTLAINNYRAIGGGDYGMFDDAKIIKIIDETTVEIVTNYLKRHPNLVIEKLNNPIIK
jgi:2',3'-cyclic-nucleotide 2'-phosphodiesterase/3'-nucleotidase